MSVLSEQDLKKSLGKDLIVYPFNRKISFRSDRLCVTASNFAYSLTQKKLLEVINHNGIDVIKLPVADTVLIWTNESLVVSRNLCGTVHSRVTLVSRGIGHLGTTINPGWAGVLCIALHNHSQKEIEIRVGTDESNSEVIAYIRFHKLTSKSSTTYNLDDPGRLDAIPESYTPDALTTWINDPSNRWRRGNRDAILEVLRDSEDYIRLQKELKQTSTKYWLLITFQKLLPPLVVSILIILYLIIVKQQNLGDLILVLIPLVYTIVVEAIKQPE